MVVRIIIVSKKKNDKKSRESDRPRPKRRMKKRKIRTGNEKSVIDNSTSSREELVGLKADEIHYYVHYEAHDRFVLHSHLLRFTTSINFYFSAKKITGD